MFRALCTRTAALTTAGVFALAAWPQAGDGSATAPDSVQQPAQAPPAPDAPKTTQGGTRVNADAALAAEFTKRAQDYAALHRKLEGTLPNLSKEATPEQIDKYQRALERLIAEGRPNAKVGDIFTKETRAYFRRQIAAPFAGTDGRKLRASIMDENPGAIRLHVNGRYPDTVPLSTMPPQVLASLPKLPEELEYRFIGERLILLDVHAHIIVDYIEDALPK